VAFISQQVKDVNRWNQQEIIRNVWAGNGGGSCGRSAYWLEGRHRNKIERMVQGDHSRSQSFARCCWHVKLSFQRDAILEFGGFCILIEFYC